MFYLEAICSVFAVGLGQIIKGEVQKGVMLLLAFYFVIPAVVYLTLLLNASLFIYVLGGAVIFGIILWIYSFTEALLKA